MSLQLLYLLDLFVLIHYGAQLKFSVLSSFLIQRKNFIFLCSGHQLLKLFSLLEVFVVYYLLNWTLYLAHLMVALEYLVIALIERPTLVVDVLLKKT
jgi:hypothetical protein